MSHPFLVIGFCIAGTLCGIITGLTPGIHVNTLLPFLLLTPFSGEQGAVLIFSLALSHTFVDFIPSTLFGVPDDDTVLSILPGHRLLLAGRGYEAVKLTVIGSLGAFICSCIIFYPLLSILEDLFEKISPFMGMIILGFIVFSLLSEKNAIKILYASFTFLLAGIYGYIVLWAPFLPRDIVLFPVFGGLYGLSTLIVSMKTCSAIPHQSTEGKIHMSTSSLLLNVVKGGAAGIFVSLFPGIGPSHGAAVVSTHSTTRQFLLSVSGVNTANAICGLAVLYSLGTSRSGAILAIEGLIQCTPRMVTVLMASGCIASGIAAISTLILARALIRVLVAIKYRYMTVLTSSIIIITVGIITGWIGLLILGIGCSLGLLPVLLGIRRIHCMGVLLFPILIYYL
jgi:putative membrane protein